MEEGSKNEKQLRFHSPYIRWRAICFCSKGSTHQCPYQDLDGKDKRAFHLFYTNNRNEVVAATRILPQNVSYAEVSVGRVVVDKSFRRTGLGHLIMEESMNFVQAEFGLVDVRLSAQKHLENYYEKHGFKSTGKEYLEDGIPHVEMLYKSEYHESKR